MAPPEIFSLGGLLNWQFTHRSKEPPLLLSDSKKYEALVPHTPTIITMFFDLLRYYGPPISFSSVPWTITDGMGLSQIHLSVEQRTAHFGDVALLLQTGKNMLKTIAQKQEKQPFTYVVAATTEPLAHILIHIIPDFQRVDIVPPESFFEAMLFNRLCSTNPRAAEAHRNIPFPVLMTPKNLFMRQLLQT